MDLLDLWKIGVEAVRGEPAVQQALTSLKTPPSRILAVGKAACDMARPAMEAFPDCPAIVATKHGHSAHLPYDAPIYEAGHPIPDEGSVVAGAALIRFVQQSDAQDHLLCLVSGGASAVAEALPNGMSLSDWQHETETLVASGADIHAINTRRKKISGVKGGKLLKSFPGKAVTTLAISDVEGDALDVIGSGIGMAPDTVPFAFDAKIVASNEIARNAIATASQSEPIALNEETLYDDVHALAPRVATQILNGPAGLTILGGEPTVKLPKSPGRGGRNQALALAIAEHLKGASCIEVLVAGTDGTDGPTEDAGARITGATWGDGAADALTRADAGSYLAQKGALVTTGPTGTNVMDLLIARKA